MFVYLNGQLINQEEAKISPFDRGFLFGDGVYEAVRTYNGKLFYFEEHLKRLEYSLQQLNIPFKNFIDLKDVIYKVAKLNNIASDFSVYLQITRGISFPRTHYYNKSLEPQIFIFINPIKDHNKELNDGVKIILEKDTRWLRCDIKSTSLLPAVMANQKAVSNNFYEAIFYRDNLITEGSHTNFFAVKNKKLYTAPLSNLILNGVTRRVVLDICEKNKIDFFEEYININDIKEFDEFFVTGTTTEITPAVQIDDWVINSGKPGKITKLIQELFFKITTSLS
jgi:D-alanine transaminase